MKRQRKLLLLLALPAICAMMLTACGKATGPETYALAGAPQDIPVITDVVGHREYVKSSVVRHAIKEDGNVSVSCTYGGAEDIRADITDYSNCLIKEHGFHQQQAFDGTTVVLTMPGEEPGTTVSVKIEVEGEDGYTVIASVEENTGNLELTSEAETSSKAE